MDVKAIFFAIRPVEIYNVPCYGNVIVRIDNAMPYSWSNKGDDNWIVCELFKQNCNTINYN